MSKYDGSMQNYESFIRGKFKKTHSCGFEPGPLPSRLFDFQSSIVRWACRKGRAAIWADTGLGKTAMQGAWADQVVKHTGGMVLILAPLCVAHQTVRELSLFDIDVKYVRHGDDCVSGIYVTNYEMLDNFDFRKFTGVVLDESSILKSMTGRIRQKLIDASRHIGYRLSCTATPSPNDHIELGNQAEFLGVMSAAEMLAMFFIHDGGSTQNWRLKGHGVDRFWQWVSTWAVAIKSPADLGFDAERYALPPINFIDHIIDFEQPVFGELFTKPVQSLSDRRAINRESVDHRISQAASIVNGSNEQWVLWGHTNAETTAAAKAIDDAIEITGSDKMEKKESGIVDFLDGNTRVLVSKPSIFGFGINMQNCFNTCFLSITDSHESFYQAVRRFYRFGQKHIVNVHLIYTDQEQPVRKNMERKQAQADEMAENMIKHMAEFNEITASAQYNRVAYLADKKIVFPQWLQEEIA